MKKSNAALLVVLALLLALVLQRTVTQRHSPTEDPQNSAGELAKNNPSARNTASPRPLPEVFSRTGAPSPVKPYPRGLNNERNHETPVTRELSPELVQREPAVMAMTPADGRLELLPEETDLHTLRARRLVLDSGALDQVVNGTTSRLVAPTSGDDVLMLDIHSVKTRSSQSHTLFGSVQGEEETSKVQLVYHDGIIHGSVNRYPENQHYEYRILADGHMMVRELDELNMTAKCGSPGETAEQTEQRIREELASDGIHLETAPDAEGETAPDTTGWTTVDVVVGYDQAARVADGGVSQIEARIISSVDTMSAAFINSLVTNAELMLLGTIEDPNYVFPGSVDGSMSEELGYLNTTGDGKLDTVSNYATLLGADLKSFVVKEADGSAGIAYLPGSSSIVARDYMTSTRITFAHELGHNMGCDHSWGDSSQSYHSRYCWRFIGTGGTKARTIMAYDWDWGTRVPYFSNPAVSYLGAATGAVNGYNAQGDATADQRYVVGGLGYSGSSSTRTGFNGSNSALGANNANTLKTGAGNGTYGVTYAKNRTTRAALGVTSPLAGAEWIEGSSRTISYKGGDMDYTASLDLYKGATLRTNIANGFNAINRNVQWTVPAGLPVGSDYTIKVTLTQPGKPSVSFNSGLFTITNLPTTVVSQSPLSSTPTSAPFSQLTVNFSAPMDPAAFSVASHIRSFTGPGGGDIKSSITGVAWSVNNTRLTVNFTPQSPQGYYRMVFSGAIPNANGVPLDQDLDSNPGEVVEDGYIGLIWVVGAGQGLQTIWSDLVGTDTCDAGWTIPAAPSATNSWETGNAAENGTTGPSTSFDGNPIIATNLDGNFNKSEQTWVATPTINCGSFKDVTLSFKGWKGLGMSDQLYIDVWHGGLWKTIYRQYGPTGGANDGAWTTYTPALVLSGVLLADSNPSFKLRWGVYDNTSNSATPSTGWQIDSIVLKGVGAATVPPAPRVIAHTPSGTDPASVGSVWVDFSQPMDTAGFSLSDITSFTGPAGSITATGFDWIHDSMLRIDFPTQSAFGNYALALGPQIPDSFAKNLDQDGDGTPGESGQDGYTASFVIGVVVGPLHHFDITGIGATQTLGSPINGITITAKDAAGLTVESFTGTVNFGGTGGFSGTSANFVNGQVSGVSLTPTQAGTNLTLTADNGAGITGYAAITTIQTQYAAWAGGMSADDDANGDGVENGLAWVLGADSPQANAISLMPDIDDTSDPQYYIFNYRRRDAALTNPDTTIEAQRAGDLSGWSALVHDGTNIIIAPVNDFHGPGIDKVQVKVKRDFAPGGSLFMRLGVTIISQQSPLE